MAYFLEPLLHDLAERFRFLNDELAGIQAPPEAEPCRQQIQRLVSRGKARIDSVLTDPDIARPDFAKNFYHTFKRLTELAQAVEEGPLFVLSRFRLEDRFLTRVVGAVCRESGFSDPAPICAALSSQYYFSMPGMDLILVPHGEATHLLAWADLYHELGGEKVSGTFSRQVPFPAHRDAQKARLCATRFVLQRKGYLTLPPPDTFFPPLAQRERRAAIYCRRESGSGPPRQPALEVSWRDSA